MDPFSGKIGVIGAGALGGFYGARLSRAGSNVHFLLRGDYEHVRRHGLKIKSFEGDFELRPPVAASAEELGFCELILIGLKTTDNAALEALLRPTVGPETLVLTLQNGFGNEEAIASTLGRISTSPSAAPPRERVLGGVAIIASTRIAPGVIHHTDYGRIRLAEFSGPARERTHAIAEMFHRAGIACEVHDSLRFIRWTKLVWNIPFSGLGVAAGGADAAAILADPELLAAARGLMEETIAAARADGATIESAFADEMIRITQPIGAYRTSMQLDYEAGRPLEVESILGEPLRRARAAGVATPRLELLYGIVRRLDTLRHRDTAPSK